MGQKYWGWGYDTVQIVYDYIINEKTYPPFISSGMDIVTRNNIAGIGCGEAPFQIGRVRVQGSHGVARDGDQSSLVKQDRFRTSRGGVLAHDLTGSGIQSIELFLLNDLQPVAAGNGGRVARPKVSHDEAVAA